MELNPELEKERLESIASDSWYARGANGTSVKYLGEIFTRHFVGTSCLELGPAEGLMTQLFVDRFEEVTLVDGSEAFVDGLRKKFRSANVVLSLFEEFVPTRFFDTIIMGHILEHVADPIGLLRNARNWLSSNGRILAAVPNSRSIHREAAVLMGLLSTRDSFSPSDVRNGHRRVYDLETLQVDFESAGLEIYETGGYWLKPLSNQQIEETWSEQMLNAFMMLGERFPHIAAEIYVIAGK